MSSSEPTIVHAPGAVPEQHRWHRIEASSAETLLEAVSAAMSPGVHLVVAVDDAATDHETLAALVSVLVIRGVRSFETRSSSAVRRILDLHAAIAAGSIAVLEQ